MYTLTIIVHVFVCLILIGVVLLQAGKGAEMGAAFGGSSQTVFGSRGAATFLSKLTVGAAVVFMVTSLTLSILSADQNLIPTTTKSSPSSSAPAETESSSPSEDTE